MPIGVSRPLDRRDTASRERRDCRRASDHGRQVGPRHYRGRMGYEPPEADPSPFRVLSGAVRHRTRQAAVGWPLRCRRRGGTRARASIIACHLPRRAASAPLCRHATCSPPECLPAIPSSSRDDPGRSNTVHLLRDRRFRGGRFDRASAAGTRQFTCVFAVLAAWRWLACYELWYESGEWPLAEAK